MNTKKAWTPNAHNENMAMRAIEGDHVSPAQNHAGQECPTLAAASGKSQPYQDNQPRRHRAVRQEKIKRTEWPAIQSQEV